MLREKHLGEVTRFHARRASSLTPTRDLRAIAIAKRQIFAPHYETGRFAQAEAVKWPCATPRTFPFCGIRKHPRLFNDRAKRNDQLIQLSRRRSRDCSRGNPRLAATRGRMIRSIVLSLILFSESIGIGSCLWQGNARVNSTSRRISRPGRSLTFPDASMILVRKDRSNAIDRSRGKVLTKKEKKKSYTLKIKTLKLLAAT